MSANVPALQSTHVVWPLESWNVPALHEVHGSLPVGLELPAGQGCALARVAIAPVSARPTRAGRTRCNDRCAMDLILPLESCRRAELAELRPADAEIVAQLVRRARREQRACDLSWPDVEGPQGRR